MYRIIIPSVFFFCLGIASVVAGHYIAEYIHGGIQHNPYAEIDKILDKLLDDIPTSERARVSIIRSDIIVSSGQTPLLRFDVPFGRGSPGHSMLPTLENRPLSEWKDYLNNMINNICTLVKTSLMEDQTAKERLTKLGINAFIACPLISGEGRLLGGIFVSWFDENPMPIDIEEYSLLLQTITNAGSQVTPQLLKIKAYRN